MLNRFVCWLVVVAITVLPVSARVRSYQGGARPAVQNRSANANRNLNANRNTNVNRNANVNRNVNVNQNVNVNRNVNVYGGYHGGCCYYDDHDWNWGSFAAGAAVGVATTAAVAAATAPKSTTVVVSAPAVGTVVSALPGSCGAISTGNAVVYNCNNVYYSPFYQGTSVVYQVVTYP